jgi:transposase-like protein
MAIEFKGRWFEKEFILQCVRWYVAYPLSYRQLEELMEERGVDVDHSTINRWVLKYAPELEEEFRKRKKPVGSSWRVDETYVKVKGHWKYLGSIYIEQLTKREPLSTFCLRQSEM